jgi:hypothetical protein
MFKILENCCEQQYVRFETWFLIFLASKIHHRNETKTTIVFNFANIILKTILSVCSRIN